VITTCLSHVWLVGEHNPYGQDPYYALYPDPPGSAGGRLCRALGMGENEYLDTFKRRNLLHTERWSAPKAREAARRILDECEPGDALVLLGGKVSTAFGYDFAASCFVVQSIAHLLERDRALSALVVPHPSGLSRRWAEPGTATQVRGLVEALLTSRRSTGHTATPPRDRS
jgi:hypothetical protein